MKYAERRAYAVPLSPALASAYRGALGRGDTRLFPSAELRALFVRRGIAAGLVNYAVGFRDVDPARPFGLSYGWAMWATTPHVVDVPGVPGE